MPGMIRYFTRARYSAHRSAPYFSSQYLSSNRWRKANKRDDEDEVGPGPRIREVAEGERDRDGEKPLAQVVQVAGRTPEAAAEDLPVVGLDVLRLDDSEELPVRPPLEGVLLQVRAARDAPTRREEQDRSHQPDVLPSRRESGIRVEPPSPREGG